MQVEVYLDVLILENVVVNYLILWVTAKLSRNIISGLRLAAASLVGALYLVLIFFPGMGIYHTATAKFLLSLAIVAIAFSPHRLKGFIKTLAVFYLVSFIFAGSFIAFSYFAEGGAITTNGIIYTWNPKWKNLVYTMVFILVIIRVAWNYMRDRFARESLFVPLSIVFDKKKVTIKALIDTGNSLHDPISNIPVIIVEFNSVREILPGDIRNIFTDSKDWDLERITAVISKSEWISRFRLIPFTSLGKEYGMLVGFRPDYVSFRVDEELRKAKDVIVGIYNKRLSRDDDYTALLSPKLVA